MSALPTLKPGVGIFGRGAPAPVFALLLIASMLSLAAVVPAHATLGRSAATVQTDRARFSARMASARDANFTVHTLTLANGGVVREYEGADGMVFAVAWRAPGRPDLQQLLGDNFATLQADTATVAGPRVRRPLSVERSGLVMHSGGHPGGFWGVAYLPQALPSGVSPQDLH